MGNRLPFCIRRGAIYYWRRRLPSPSKMSVEFSLGTKDERIARRLCLALATESDRAFAVLREGGMTPQQTDDYMRQKFVEHRAKMDAVHLVGLDRDSDWRPDVIASKAAALALNTLALRGQYAQVDRDRTDLSGDPDAGEVLRLAVDFIEPYRQEFWSEHRYSRLYGELGRAFPGSAIEPPDVARARSALLQAMAAANLAAVKKFGDGATSFDGIERLAAQLEEDAETVRRVSLAASPDRATPRSVVHERPWEVAFRHPVPQYAPAPDASEPEMFPVPDEPLRGEAASASDAPQISSAATTGAANSAPFAANVAQAEQLGTQPMAAQEVAAADVASTSSDPAATALPALPRNDIMAFAEEMVATDVGTKDIREPTARQTLAVIRLFVEATGKRHFQDLVQADIARYVDCLNRLPKIHGKSSKTRDLPLAELLASAASLPAGEVGLAAGTVNRNLSYLTKLMRKARMGGIEHFPHLEIGGFRRKKKVKANEKRPSFKVEDVQRLFVHPIWTGCQSAARRHVPGNVIVWDGTYWCPLITAYSGVRLEEVAGLRLCDLVMDGEVPHFVIEETVNRTVKTVASVRKVPIHPVLLDLGFRRYVEQRRKAGDKDLFPELQPNPGTRTAFGDRLYEKFTKAVKLSLGAARVEKDRTKTFHSFRHYVSTYLGKVEGVLPKTIDDIVGHESTGTNDRVYKDPTELAIMLKALLHLPDVTHPAKLALNSKALASARRKPGKGKAG